MQLDHGKQVKVKKNSFFLSLLGLSAASMILKATLTMINVLPFNSDEAIVGLMARHILQGKWPVFFYGQSYMGTLDASLVAGAFSLFGPHISLIRVVQILLYAGTIFTTGYLGRQIFRSEAIGLLAAGLMVIPSVNVTLYTTVSLGGYGEVLLLGNLLIIAALKISTDSGGFWYALWGFLAGLGMWAFGLILIYIVPTSILLIYFGLKDPNRKRSIKNLLLTVMMILLGLSPWLGWAFSHGVSQLLQELFGSAISGASSANPFVAILAHMYNFLLFSPTVIFGLRPPWEIRWLAQPLLPIVLAFWLVVFFYAFRNLRKMDEAWIGRWILVGVLATLAIGFIITPFGADPSGRYFLPFAVPMSLFAAEFCINLTQRSGRIKWAYLMPVFVLTYNLWGTVETAQKNPPGLTTQFDSITWIDHSYDEQLIDFLIEKGEMYGYTNYWVAYPIAFQSNEEIIYVPALPYHQDFRFTVRDNRYSPYNTNVEESDHIAYITTNHPELDQVLLESFQQAGITWQDTQIGDYHIFYQLSEVIRPEDLGIYELQP
jgi:4-amino-4-deoxy-L-arabinose transferase-like glycosyltransferase